MTLGTGGSGSVSHILGSLFQKQTGTRFQFIPYKSGVGVAVQDMTAGHIDFLWSVAANVVALLKSGAIKGFAVTSKDRLEILPENSRQFPRLTFNVLLARTLPLQYRNLREHR